MPPCSVIGTALNNVFLLKSGKNADLIVVESRKAAPPPILYDKTNHRPQGRARGSAGGAQEATTVMRRLEDLW